MTVVADLLLNLFSIPPKNFISPEHFCSLRKLSITPPLWVALFLKTLLNYLQWVLQYALLDLFASTHELPALCKDEALNAS